MNEREEWHHEQTARINRIASEMGRLFTPSYQEQQTSDYYALQQSLLWEEHIKAEHDKFIPPEYGDHRDG